MQDQGRMQEMWARTKADGKVVLPRAPWVLSKVEEQQVKKTISEFRAPTRLMDCLKGAFTKHDDLTGLKSHD